MEYEVGMRLDILERAVRELQEATFPERFKLDKKEDNKEKMLSLE